MPPNSVRVAVAQMTSVNDVAANFATCSRLVKEAAAAGAKLLAFPEAFSFVGVQQGESVKIAETLDGSIMQRYCNLARESQIWLSLGGFQEKGSDDSHLCNTHVIVDDTGNIKSKYRKIHLFDVDVPGGAVYKESSFTEAGKELVAVDSPFGRLGLTVIAAAQAGKHNEKRESYGDSLIIDPWGTVVARLPDKVATGIAVADIDFSFIDSVRMKMPIDQQRKEFDLQDALASSL